MATTRYVVAATASYPEPKTISNLKSARAEADARAKTDRVDVQVTTLATGKLTYTAQGAPLAPAPEPTGSPADDIIDVPDGGPINVADLRGELTPEEEEHAEGYAEAIEQMAEAEIAAGLVPAPDATDDADVSDEEFSSMLSEVIDETVGADTVADALTEKGDDATEDTKPRVAKCGCSVDAIISTGEHGKGCADAPVRAAKTQAVKKAAPAKAPRKATAKKDGAPRAAARRAALGEAAVPGWELLYDKPRQNAQVGRKDGKYALICTTHKTVRPVAKLVEERAVRKAGGWCTECSH